MKLEKELLDSNRANFLIWRYLLEGNYRETAAKFQKEWHIAEPHRHFDFASHVEGRALVQILNKGLQFLAIEREYAKQQLQSGDAAAVTKGVFGPLAVQPPLKEDEVEDEEPDVDEVELSRKRQAEVDQTDLNGLSAKRQRLSNGYENGVDAATTPMEIDHAHNHADNNHAYPSPLEGERVPSPCPRTEGPDQGTQMEKVTDLASETTFLRLAPDESSESSPSRTVQNPIVLHCEWSPRDPSLLAAAGTDALARVWTVPHATAPNPVPSHVNGDHRSYHDLTGDDISRTSTVTAMSWNWDGTAIAIATESGNKASVNVWGFDGSHMQRFDVAEPPIIKLRWNPDNGSVLAIAPENGGTMATVLPANTSSTLSYLIPNHDLNENPVDAAWTNPSEFLLCGGSLLAAFQCSNDAVTLRKAFEARERDNFLSVQFDWRSKLVATSSSQGAIDLWNESGERRTISGHDGAVSSLVWQPLQSNPTDEERLIATGGEDGAIFIWNARIPENKPKCSMTMDLPIVALAFTPDGSFIAGATTERILIWKVGDHAIPRACWNRNPQPSSLSPKPNSEGEEEDTFSLCWDASGQKLAYGANSRLAVINFQH